MPLPRIRLRDALASGRSRAARRTAFLLLFGLSISIVPTVTVLAQNMPLLGQSASEPYAAHIADAAQRFGIPEHWIQAVVRVESAGAAHAISSAGAMGLMQVMPDTWAELRARYRLGADPYLPRDNILAGTAYLREMWDRYGNVGAMLAAYNAGPGRYDEYLATGHVLPTETRAYVARLAPLLGGDPQTVGVVAAAAPPSDWRQASLFSVPSGRSEVADPVRSGEDPESIRAAVPARDDSGITPRSDGLFVGRPDPGASQ